MLVSIIFTVILNLIAMGSNIAYNMLLTLNVSGLMTSYIICVACTSHDFLSLKGFNLTHSRCFLPPELG
jgi:amino acid transporter